DYFCDSTYSSGNHFLF
nr:immunoglobulin light chain junction region [Macaca mulatta]MOX69994.1 immunoglobulin light chain junction region [Macaca mulatta]MOX72430.1 immunoglobulin light chain junction region [Macaca mulatta]MOX75956.1 immunoglobulin light chain junction region [Macaca mulatta]